MSDRQARSLVKPATGKRLAARKEHDPDHVKEMTQLRAIVDDRMGWAPRNRRTFMRSFSKD